MLKYIDTFAYLRLKKVICQTNVARMSEQTVIFLWWFWQRQEMILRWYWRHLVYKLRNINLSRPMKNFMNGICPISIHIFFYGAWEMKQITSVRLAVYFEIFRANPCGRKTRTRAKTTWRQTNFFIHFVVIYVLVKTNMDDVDYKYLWICGRRWELGLPTFLD